MRLKPIKSARPRETGSLATTEEESMATELVLLGTAGAPMPVAGRGGSRQYSLPVNGSSSSIAGVGRPQLLSTRDWTSPVWRRYCSLTSMPTTSAIYRA